MSFLDYITIVFLGIVGAYSLGYLVGLGAWHGYGQRAALRHHVNASMRDLDKRIHG